MILRAIGQRFRTRVSNALGLVDVQELKAARAEVEAEKELKKTAWTLLRDTHKRSEDMERTQCEIALTEIKDRGGEDATPSYVERDPQRRDSETHPVFGRLLHDFGYKRVYATPLKNVLDRRKIPFWRRNRVFRKERSKNIARDMLSKRKDADDGEIIGFPGVITVFEALAKIEDGAAVRECGVLDGQHRLGALKVLKKKGAIKDEDEVLLEVLGVETERTSPETVDEQVCSIFKEINKAEPVKFVDLPSSDAATESERQILNEAAEKLRDTFPDMFKHSQRCRTPHVNIDNLRDMVFKARIVKSNNIQSSEELFAWFLERNGDAGKTVDNPEWVKRCRRLARRGGNSGIQFERALTKSKTHNFYLGLTNDWIDG